MSAPRYLEPLRAGALNLKNRVVFAPCTRNRAHVPGPAQAEYYAQRATAGLIISEATMPELQGYEHSNAPGLYEPAQIKGWKLVTDAVHAKGGLIVAQVMNIGRVAHPLLQGGRMNYGPSAIRAAGGKFRQLNEYPHYNYTSGTVQTQAAYVTPEAIEDPWTVVASFKQGFVNAKEAGFDGVEAHGANGYLIHQFLDSSANQRTDEWGGSPERRARFALEVVKAAIDVWGADRVGIKLSPSGGYNDMGMSKDETLSTYGYLLSELHKLDIAYVHFQRWFGMFDPALRGTILDMDSFRSLWPGTLLANGDYTPREGLESMAKGESDALVFGRHFMSNPDLPTRCEEGLPLNSLDFTTLYGHTGAKGYSDYKSWSELSESERATVASEWAAVEKAHDEDRAKVPALMKQQDAEAQTAAEAVPQAQ